MRRIVDELVAADQHVIVLGDLNEGQPAEDQPPRNLTALFDPAGPLVSCYDLDTFDVGGRPGTFDSCGIRNRLDYLLLSRSLQPAFTGGQVYRKGLWGRRTTRPDKWDTYPEMTATHVSRRVTGAQGVLTSARLRRGNEPPERPQMDPEQ